MATSSGVEGNSIGTDENQLLHTLVKMLKKGSGDGSRPSTSLRLAKMPGCGDHVLPSVKEWQMWYDVKLRSWAGAQSEGFADAIDL